MGRDRVAYLFGCRKSLHRNVCKSATKMGQRDRFALITCGDGPGALKCSFADPPMKLLNESKLISATDLDPIGVALSRAFELLNLRRVAVGADGYGFGRQLSAEAAVIVTLTDGAGLTHPEGVQDSVRAFGYFGPHSML